MLFTLDNWIYYLDYDKEAICRMTLNGWHRTVLFDTDAPTFQFSGVNLEKKVMYLYVPSSDDYTGTLYEYNIEKKSDRKEVATDLGKVARLEGDYVYYDYEKEDGKYSACRLNLKTKERDTLIEDMGIFNMIYHEGKIYYSSEDCLQLRCYDVGTKEDELIYEEAGKSVEVHAVLTDGIEIGTWDVDDTDNTPDEKLFWLNLKDKKLIELN